MVSFIYTIHLPSFASCSNTTTFIFIYLLFSLYSRPGLNENLSLTGACFKRKQKGGGGTAEKKKIGHANTPTNVLSQENIRFRLLEAIDIPVAVSEIRENWQIQPIITPSTRRVT